MDDCVEWAGRRNRGGYGVVAMKAHRLAWISENGPIPDGLFVLHKCDNRACVNVDHLFLGTNLDNIRDAQRKGRLQMATHGSKGMYQEHKCRCSVCLLAKAERQRNYRLRKKREAQIEGGMI